MLVAIKYTNNAIIGQNKIVQIVIRVLYIILFIV
jgi:hypothetical protein